MKDNGLMIAAIVAIVAVVGLVILFNGNMTGKVAVCPTGYRVQANTGYGGQGVYECIPNDMVPADNAFPNVVEKKARTKQILTEGY